MVIYQDLDGCLADFCTGFSKKVFEYTSNPRLCASSPTLREYMPKFIRKYGRTYRSLTEGEVSDPICRPLLYKIAAEPGFFYNLPRLRNGLWEIVNRFPVEKKILSAPIGDFAVEDKTRWVREVLGDLDIEVIIVPRAEKINHGHKGAVLIDDYDKTVTEWKSAGFNAFQWATGKEEELLEYLNGLEI